MTSGSDNPQEAKPVVWTIVVAGGSGSRYGGLKQFDRLGGRRIVDRAIDAARAVSRGVVVVVPEGSDSGEYEGVDSVVVGGESRADSVRAGLGQVPSNAEIVVVHDAARPLASRALFDAVISAVAEGADGAIPGIPVADTLKRALVDANGNRRVEMTIERDNVVAVQTPQAFRASLLRHAHESGDHTTDDAHLVEAAGGSVVIVDGDHRNFKVTTPSDMALAETLLVD